MKIKTVLKGIGRLMLTTAVMCGVGLFLCSSEVKADVNVSLEAGSEANGNPDGFTVTVNSSDENDSIASIKTIKLYKDSTTLIYSDSPTWAVIPGTESKYTISKSDFIKGIGIKTENLSSGDGSPVNINNVGIIYIDSNGNEQPEKKLDNALDPAIQSASIYKVAATKSGDYSEVKLDPTYIYKVGERTSQYGYKDEEYTVSHDTSVANYYMLVKSGDSAPSDSEWKQAGDIKGKLSDTQNNNKLTVSYLPKVTSISVSASSNTTNTKLIDTTSPKSLSAISNSIEEIATTVTFGIDSLISSAESTADKNTVQGYYKVECVPSLSSETTAMQLNVPPENVIANQFDVKMQLNNTNSVGTGKVTTKLVLGNLTVASVDLPITLGCKPTGIIFQNVPISVMVGGGSQVVQVLKGIEPSGANQNFSSYSGEIIETTSGDKLLEQVKYDSATGAVTVQAKSTATPGATAKVKLTLTDSFSNAVFFKEFDVKIISFDKNKTIDSINKSNKNYITYNKDKGYSLDIKQLIIDNAKDSNGDSITLTKDQITNVTVGGSSCTDGLWKPSEAALNKKVSFTLNGSTTIDSDKFKVSAYPMPTATYSSSNRTLTVKIPTKVSTAYSDDNNIRQSKGFKLLLVDSSGNTLYEYTDSKYQSVLSSSSESTVSYTVTASDIEGMITSAASNGKFSADTTSVKFKVIPMGYKQSSSSDETIKAKDEIAGTTDAVTVYKVSASGTNFTSTAAYGLDGQTVSLTATPNSGYTFKQWSDGNTSNPRQIKVSASGTRSFQAVAGERVANSTGAGGTDNSALYDDVPKTSESNSAIWLIVFMVFAVMGTTYALYLQLRAANSKHDR